MDDQKRKIRICRACGHKREYDYYHQIKVACKKCARIRCAKHDQKKEKILEKSRLYCENMKDKPERNRKTVNTCTENVQDLYNQINTLREMVKSTTLVA